MMQDWNLARRAEKEQAKENAIVKTDKPSLDKLLDEVVDLLNADERGEALKVFRQHFGIVTRWVCVKCGNVQDTLLLVDMTCEMCGADMIVKVVRTKEVKA